MVRPMMRKNLLLAVLSGLLFVGCGDDDMTMDASVESDASIPMDSSVPDTSPEPDASIPDASEPDTSIPEDASVPDTSTPDASSEDAGGGGTCEEDYTGSYSVTLDPANPPLCSMVPLSTCSATLTAPNEYALDCSGTMATCMTDGSCVCTGTAMVMGFTGNVSIDFANSTVAVSALGITCAGTLAAE